MFIYVLKHPLDNIVRYVGKTNNIKSRFYNHIHSAKKTTKNTHLYNWIRALLKDNTLPIIQVIEECDNWQEREMFWIKHFNRKYKLCNHSKGGEGPGVGHKNCVGRKYSKETILKMSQSRKLILINSDIRLKLSEAGKRRVMGKNGNAKRVICLISNKQYNCLREGFLDLKIKYNSEIVRIKIKSKKASFKYI